MATSGIAGIWRTYLTPFASFEWFAVLVSVIVVCMLLRLVPQTEKLNRAAIAVGRLKQNPLTVEDQNSVVRYVESLQALARYFTWCEWVMAIYPLLAIIRLMKAFHAQSRLSHVTTTLIAAADELAPCLLMFLFALASFALSGFMLFGRQIAEFSSLPRSMTMCFLILSGNFDFSSMADVGYYVASVWLVSFVLLVGLVLFNIFLGIILEAYYGVKADLREGTTLVQEIWHVGQAFFSRGRDRKVSLNRILRALTTLRVEDFFDDDGCADSQGLRDSTWMENNLDEAMAAQWRKQPLFVENLITEVNRSPDGVRQRKAQMDEIQATEVLVSSVTKYYWSNWKPPTMTDNIISASKLQLDTLRLERLNTPAKLDENTTASEILGQDATTSERPGNHAQKMRDLRREIEGFLVEVQANRQERACEVARLRAEVGTLRRLVDEQRIGTGQSGPPELGLSSKVDPSATLGGMFTSESPCSERPLNQVDLVHEHLYASKDVVCNSEASPSRPHILPTLSSKDGAAVVKRAASSSAPPKFASTVIGSCATVAPSAVSGNSAGHPVKVSGLQASQTAAIAAGEPFPRRAQPVAPPESSVSHEPQAPTEAAAVAASAALGTTPPLQPGARLQCPSPTPEPSSALRRYPALLQRHGLLPANYKHSDSEGEDEIDQSDDFDIASPVLSSPNHSPRNGPVSTATCSSESSEWRGTLTDDQAESEDDVSPQGDRERCRPRASQSSKASLLGGVQPASSEHALADGSHGDDMNLHRPVVPTWCEEQRAFPETRPRPPFEMFRRDASFTTFSEAQHRVRWAVSKPELLNEYVEGPEWQPGTSSPSQCSAR
eukprot:TRINITY_DN16776_c0_g1_i1.p1 TRINITY_DN16776_c0_g1~~TRINITY_DN16776_c0_g1_i1.p1  ORF type:complete len:852 (-),score=111.03 TRINITY_DN16776_c0_g1_i1:34-2541(-)